MQTGGSSRCHAARRVNPFAGVTQIVDAPFGRATSTDGVHWDLEIVTDRARVLGGLERDAAGRSFIRFGLWCAGHGHRMAPSKTVLMGDAELREKSDRLIAEVLEQQPGLPFELTDSRELWLFDESGQLPLALLATQVPGRVAVSPGPRTWCCSHGGDRGLGPARFDEGRAVELLINRRAGYNSKRSWVTRQPDGAGIRDACRTRVESGLFPRLLVRRQWADDAETALVERYLRWVAPSLLTLPDIDDGERDWLERQLHVHAASVEHHWRLYPKVLSPSRIRAARVQGRLMRAQTAATA